ncbi:MAG TPA: MFS transporter [Microbacteriaceae bacterium]|nr:MFS transporter [Microbacteriaceae bacterium]
MTAPQIRFADVGLRSSRGPILLAVMLSTGLAALDVTVLSTAVPTIVEDLGGFAQYPWLFSIYVLASAVTVPVYSKLADTLGRKPVMLVGIGIFVVGSALCSGAWDMPTLIVFRAIQGIGAGAIQPVAMTILGDIYTIAERAKAQAYTSSMWALASVGGPLIGGAFAQFGLWRLVFLVNVPLGIAAMLVLWRKYHERLERRPHRIDYLGAVLITASTGLIILGLLEGGNTWDWLSPWSFGVFGLGLLVGVAFLVAELRAAEPIIPLGLFRSRLMSSGVVMNIAIGMGIGAMGPFIPLYLQVGAGVTPIAAGAAVGAFTIGWPLAVMVSGRLYLRFGFRATGVLGGSILVAAATAAVAVVQWPSAWLVAALAFVLGTGFGWTAMPSLIASQSSVAWSQRGVVSGIVIFCRTIGQAVGTAVLAAVSITIIAQHGGDETDPAAMIAATRGVFIGVVVIAVLILLGAFGLPGRRATEAQVAEEQVTVIGPAG